jgi:hypothetical protein
MDVSAVTSVVDGGLTGVAAIGAAALAVMATAAIWRYVRRAF